MKVTTYLAPMGKVNDVIKKNMVLCKRELVTLHMKDIFVPL